ncbi:ABC transporter substrate-binding protein [Bacillaceae bacterium SAOS 7]|nr:ABC transporter substrate-binding protein [Bacillaceae bacterium SAOS 7]
MLTLFIALLTLFVISACSNTSKEADNESNEKEINEKTKVLFWHSVGGGQQPVLEEIVENYNKSQDKYEVVAVSQGSYDDTLLKFRNSGPSNDSPAIVHVNETSSKFMIDSGKTIPINDWIKKDNFDVSFLEKAVANYYTIDGKLYSMPFNSSAPILVYNKDMFKKVGLDPENPPKTYSEIKAAAEKLTTKDGNNTVYGFNMRTISWFFEELLATQGGLLINGENGRAQQATEAVFNGKEGQATFNFIDDLNKDGLFAKYGRSGDDVDAAFYSEKVGMYLTSSAVIRSIVDNANFEVGVGSIPHPDNVDPQGIVIGGGSLWMTNMVEENVQKGAWDFMKYMEKADVQAKWHVSTGFFPINTESYNLDIVKEEQKKYPQLKVAIEQLQNTKPSPATQGALSNVFPEIRSEIEKAFEAAFYSERVEPAEALDNAKKAADKIIENANRVNNK